MAFKATKAIRHAVTKLARVQPQAKFLPNFLAKPWITTSGGSASPNQKLVTACWKPPFSDLWVFAGDSPSKQNKSIKLFSNMDWNFNQSNGDKWETSDLQHNLKMKMCCTKHPSNNNNHGTHHISCTCYMLHKDSGESSSLCAMPFCGGYSPWASMRLWGNNSILLCLELTGDPSQT